MNLSRRQKAFCWALLCGWLVLITFLSAQNGVDTAKTSKGLAAVLTRMLDLPEKQSAALDHSLRKAAHWIAFFVLEALVYLAARISYPLSRRLWLLTGLGCSCAAAIDEAKKVLIPGRHFSWSETLLNITGVWCAVALMLLVLLLRGQRKQTEKTL